MTQLSLAFQNLVYGCGCFCTILFVAVLPSSFVVTVHGHGLLTHPPSKNGGTLSIPDEGSTTHFARASYGIIDKAFFHQDHSKTPWTRPGDFDHHLAADLIAGHPETLHPCGCNAAVNIGECAGVVHASGFGERLYDLDDIEPVSWSQGSIQETAWNAWANHAGGDIFMLCSKQDFDACRDTLLPNPPRDATEEQTTEYLNCVWNCFESHTLEWAEEDDESSDWSQKIQYEDEDCTYATMTPQVKVGKDGNLHRYTPIPDSLQVTNGGEGMCMWDSVTSFSNQRAYSEFLSSFGDTDTCDWGPDSHSPYQWHVFDKVVVPTDIPTGEYLLSWRWDGYMADQMWTNCADVRIVDQNDASGQSVFGSDGCPTMPPTPVVDSSPPPTPSPLPPPTQAPTTPSPPTSTPPPTPPSNTALHCDSGYTGLRPYDSCKSFYHCVSGELRSAGVTPCPAGTLFDMEFQYCNWSHLVDCTISQNDFWKT